MRSTSTLFALLIACTGSVDDLAATSPGDGPRDGPEAEAGADPSTGVAPTVDGEAPPGTAPEPNLPRLTGEEYQATLRFVLGDPGFQSPYRDPQVRLTESGFVQLRDSAELAWTRRDRWKKGVIPCDLAASLSESQRRQCAEAMVDDLGRLLFRRDVLATEKSALLGLYDDARAGIDGQPALGFPAAIGLLAQVLLTSPQFLYRLEVGVEDPSSLPPGIRRLTQHELVTRLSLFILGRGPGPWLLDQADAGRLQGEGLREVVSALLETEDGQQRLVELVQRWLYQDGGKLGAPLSDIERDGSLYPAFNPSLAAAMATELEALIRRTVVEPGGGGLEALFASREAYVNGPMADLYGVRGPAAEHEWSWVVLPEGERAGALTRAAVMTVLANQEEPHPIFRGVFLLERVLCTEFGPLPMDADLSEVAGGGTETLRQLWEERTSGSDCVACHTMINPMGFAFNHYDAVGRWRATEPVSGLPIDATGALYQLNDVDRVGAPVQDGVELSEKLAASARPGRCLAQQVLTAAVGGPLPRGLQDPAVDAAGRDFFETGRMADLVYGVVESDAFQQIRTSTVSEETER